MTDVLGDLSEYLNALLDALLYPFMLLLSAIGNLIHQLLSPFVNFFNQIYILMSGVYVFLDGILSFFPEEWRLMILTLVGIMVALAVFAYIWN